MSKYRAVKTTIDNITFASKKEARRYTELKLLFRAGQIRNLELQPKLKIEIDGVHVCDYQADFAYFEDGRRIYEDTKGFKTPVYRLKKKLVHALYGIQIRET